MGKEAHLIGILEIEVSQNAEVSCASGLGLRPWIDTPTNAAMATENQPV